MALAVLREHAASEIQMCVVTNAGENILNRTPLRHGILHAVRRDHGHVARLREVAQQLVIPLLPTSARAVSLAMDAFKDKTEEADKAQGKLAVSVAETTRELHLFGLEALGAGSRAAAALESSDKVVKQITTSTRRTTTA